MIQFHRPADIAVTEVAQPDRGLDQPLIILLLRAEGLHPQRFPDLVGFEEIAAIEQDDAGQVARIVKGRASIHIYIVGGEAPEFVVKCDAPDKWPSRK